MRVPANVLKCLRDGCRERSFLCRADRYMGDTLGGTHAHTAYRAAREISDLFCYPVLFIRDVMDGVSGSRIRRE